MAKQRIEKLTLTKFRGSCQSTIFEFDDKKSIALIFGENGTGKSSIADALDFVCNNEFGSLRDRSGTTPHAHIVALDAQPNELEVALHFGGKQWRAKLQGRNPKTTPAQQPRAFILRRADITRVMEAQPADRYKTLQAYITVPNVERAEAELRKATRDAAEAVERAVKEHRTANDALEKFWIAEGRPEGDPLRWAQRKTSEDTHAVGVRLAAMEQLVTAVDQATHAQSHCRQTQEQVTEAHLALEAAEREMQRATGAQAGQSDALLTLLQDADLYFQTLSEGEHPCPVCGKPETKATLAERVRAELAQLTELQRLHGRRKERQQAVAHAQGALANAQYHFVQQCLELAPLLSNAPLPAIRALDALPLATVSTASAALTAAGRVLETLAKCRADWVAICEADQKTSHQMNALQTQLQLIAQAGQVMHEQQALSTRLTAMHKVVEEGRKSYIDNLLQSIARQVNGLYAQIHPDEPLGGSKFNVKKKTSGSLELKADFGGATDIAPTAYYSEAHLDTLGLCVYLALAKRSGAGNSIVVLDDILTSVDEVYLDRVIALLAEEARHFGHLIITTHSRVWYDRMKMIRGVDADLFELHGWDLVNGIRHSRTPRPVEELHHAAGTP
jgi:energy-coupling factor transporter ATP-binding protein EcfA2